MKISVISPVYNEEKNIEPLCEEIRNSLKNFDYELLLIDDGSSDMSWEKIKQETQKDEKIKAIRFKKNFGQTQAINAGVANSLGEYIVLIDSDLQNDPNDIPMMIKAAQEGFDLVSGWRKERKDSFLTRILPSLAANKLISYITGIKLKDYGCTLKVYKSETLKDIELYGEMHRFIPALAGYRGAQIKEMTVNHRPRVAGKSKYGLFRTFKVLVDIIIVKFMGDFILKPGYFFAGISFVLLSFSFVFSLITLYYKWYNGIFVKDQPLFLVAIFLAIVAVQTALMGLLAEMSVRIYRLSSGKPDYRIKEKIFK